MPESTYTSLMDAIQTNNTRQFRSILQSKGLPENLRWLDYDLLTRAMELNRRAIVGFLLDCKCCVWKPYDKTTPLHVAVVKADWYGIIDKLLLLGARVSAENINGDTPVHVAFKNNAPASVLDMLIQSYLNETTVNFYNKEELGVLHIACTRPQMEFVSAFFQFQRIGIDLQVSFNSNSSHAGYTPLHFAVEYGRHEVVAYLLERGANIYLQDRNESTPLHLALEYCDVKMINLLCCYITKFYNIVNSRGLSHFMAACASNDLSLVESFLSVSSPETLINSRVQDTNGYPFAGYTPLHFAAVYDRVHTARLLLYCHREELFWAITARNHTAASLAFENKRYRIVNLFSIYCEGGDLWMKEVEKIDRDSVVRKLIEGKMVKEDTHPIDEYKSDKDKDLIDVCTDMIIDHEEPIQVTPLSTRSLYEKRNEVYLLRLQDMHRMSRRLLLNINQEKDKYKYPDVTKSLDFLSTVRLVEIILSTLFLLSLSVIVPSVLM